MLDDAKEITDRLNNLSAYIDEDPMYKAYKEGTPIDGKSDFDEFCIEHCKDIDTALDVITILIDGSRKLEKEKNALIEALSLVKQKKNNDKAKHRRKAKVLRTRINSVIKDIDNQIKFCTNEAEGTVNNESCWMAVNYLKKVKRMLKGDVE